MLIQQMMTMAKILINRYVVPLLLIMITYYVFQLNRKSNVKPKATATITPKTTAGSANSGPGKSVVQKPVPGKVIAAAKQPPKPKDSVKRVSTARIVDSKKKSIFSPENSSDSDSKPNTKTQPKVTTQVSSLNRKCEVL